MKIFKLMAIALVAMVGLNSCSKDCDHEFIEYDYTKDLVGTWTCMEADYAEALVIKADGSLEVTGVVDGEFFESKGTIKVVNNKMTYVLDNGDEWEGRFEMTKGESFTMVWDDELDIRYTYRYCENDLADEVVGMWVCNDGPLEGNDDMSIHTFNADGTTILTGFAPGYDFLVNEGGNTYKVIGDLLFNIMPGAAEFGGIPYSCSRIVYTPNGTTLGDIMSLTSYYVVGEDFEVVKSTVSWLRVKQNLNLTGKVYGYNSAYVTNVKGNDEDFTIFGNTFNIAKITAYDFEKLFGADLYNVELNDNLFKYRLLLDNGQEAGADIPMTVVGNKVTLDFSAAHPACRKVDIYMYQDADDSQLHIYMNTTSFINYFANLKVLTMPLEGNYDPSDSSAIEKVFTDMEARVESINVSLVLKARK